MSVFICQIIPLDLMGTVRVSQAGNTFCRNIITVNAFNKIVSMIPVGIIAPLSLKSSCEPNVTYIQCRIFPHHALGKLLNALIENWKTVQTVRKEQTIWFYNITVYNFFAFWILHCFFRKKIFVLLADFTPPKKLLDAQQLVKISLKRCSGIVSLSSRLAPLVANQHVVPGIIKKTHLDKNCQFIQHPKKIFLFSGTLNQVTGIELVLEVFSKIPEAELIITGNGDEEWIKEHTKSCKNIKWMGLLSYNEYLNLLPQVTFGLSFRNPDLPENKNNFPSKILEYLSWGKIVISTMQYPELDGIRYEYAPYNIASLTVKIQKMLKYRDTELAAEIALNRTALQRFTETMWHTTIKLTEDNAK